MLVFSIIFSTYLNYNLYKLGAAKHDEATFTHTHTQSQYSLGVSPSPSFFPPQFLCISFSLRESYFPLHFLKASTSLPLFSSTHS